LLTDTSHQGNSALADDLSITGRPKRLL